MSSADRRLPLHGYSEIQLQMFLKSAKFAAQQQISLTPAVGAYDISSQFGTFHAHEAPINRPAALQPRQNHHQRKQLQPVKSQINYRELAIDMNSPLHSYATGKSRSQQNKLHQQMKLKLQEANKIEMNHIFDTQTTQRLLPKGQLLKISKRHSKKPSHDLDTSSLFLGNPENSQKSAILGQHLKKPPKQQSLESLELYSIREKMSNWNPPPGPGSYDIQSSFSRPKPMKYMPFERSVGREPRTILRTDESQVGVGLYNIDVEKSRPKNVIQFDKYSQRTRLFQAKQEVPDYIFITNEQETKRKQVQFPPVFGSSAKRA